MTVLRTNYDRIVKSGQISLLFFCAFFLCEIFVFCEKICNFAKHKIKTSWE